MARKRHSGAADQRKASVHRFHDAEALFDKGRWRGSMYMAGYAVECRLKYKLMRRWKCFNMEELEDRLTARGIEQTPFTHSLQILLRLAEAMDRLRQNEPLWNRFRKDVNRWQPAWRYNPDLSSKQEAARFLETVKEMLHWVDNNI